MRAFTPEISWHNRLPALCADISKSLHSSNSYRMATGGNDCRVYIWLVVTKSNNLPEIQIRAGLRRHQKSVGAVRFSPQNLLASGDDDGYIYIWKHIQAESKTPPESNLFMSEDDFEDLETWQQQRVLRGHIEDICDLAWSSEGQLLLSGSVDNSAILWDAEKGTRMWCSDLTKGYIQGVALDPHGHFMAAMSSDRTLRVYNLKDKRLLNATRRMALKDANCKVLFKDDTVQTFCRRLEFSPDGQFLIAPTGQVIQKEPKKPFNVFLIFKRPSFGKPVHYYPTGREVALCARFSPVVYQLRDNPMNFWGIPYRLVFAVITSRSVIIYDSQQPTPIGYISQIHLARLTDLAWSCDGQLLVITSYDGYSTILKFDEGEFGQKFTGSLIEPVKKVENTLGHWISNKTFKKARLMVPNDKP